MSTSACRCIEPQAALRVLDTASIVRLAKDVRREISKASVERWIQEAVAANRLQRVVRGLFLNRMSTPCMDLDIAQLGSEEIETVGESDEYAARLETLGRAATRAVGGKRTGHGHRTRSEIGPNG